MYIIHMICGPSNIGGNSILQSVHTRKSSYSGLIYINSILAVMYLNKLQNLINRPVMSL